MMDSFIDIVETTKRETRIKAIDDVRMNLESVWLEHKIKNYINRWGDSIEDIDLIKNMIKENDLVASFFAKDPIKQNISEKLAIKILQVDKMPQSGHASIRFDKEGNIVSTDIREKDDTKSVDFIYNEYYITQKYTMGKGGSQDNQYKDVIDFLMKRSKKYKVGAILDGNYWNSMRMGKIKELFKDNANVLITSMQEIMDQKYAEN